MCLTLTQYRVRTGVSASQSHPVSRFLTTNYKHHKNTHRENFTGTAYAVKKLMDPLISQISCYYIILLCLPLTLNQSSDGWLRGGTHTS